MNLQEVINTVTHFKNEYSAYQKRGKDLIKALGIKFNKEPISSLITITSSDDFSFVFSLFGKVFYAQAAILPDTSMKLKSEGSLIVYTKTTLGNIDKVYLTVGFDKIGNYSFENKYYSLEEFPFVFFQQLYSAVRTAIVLNESGYEFIPLSEI